MEFVLSYIIDVNVDPKHPEFVAEFTDVYVHDGLVRDNKLWAAAIYEGGVYVYDVTDKNDFTLLVNTESINTLFLIEPE